MKEQRFIEVDGEQIPVTEEVYRAYKRPLWREHKQKEREKRCAISDGKGRTKRCEGDCGKCEKRRNGGVLSLDWFTEMGVDNADPVDMAELVADKLLLEQLLAALDDLEPDERLLINALFQDDRTERDIAAELGISHQAIGKRKQKVLAKLRTVMGEAK